MLYVGDIVPELGHLTALQTLSLRDNHFTGIVPPELGKLTALRHLFLNNNNLRGGRLVDRGVGAVGLVVLGLVLLSVSRLLRRGRAKIVESE